MLYYHHMAQSTTCPDQGFKLPVVPGIQSNTPRAPQTLIVRKAPYSMLVHISHASGRIPICFSHSPTDMTALSLVMCELPIQEQKLLSDSCVGFGPLHYSGSRMTRIPPLTCVHTLAGSSR